MSYSRGVFRICINAKQEVQVIPPRGRSKHGEEAKSSRFPCAARPSPKRTDRLEDEVAEDSSGAHGEEVEGDLSGGTRGRGASGSGGARAGAGTGARAASGAGRGSSVGDIGRGGGGGDEGGEGGLGAGGLGRGRVARGDAAGLGLAVVDDLDALPGAGAVGVDVLGGVLGALATHEVGDLDAAVGGNKGALGHVGKAASPLDGAGRGVGVAGDPAAKLDLHGRLGVARAARETLVLKRADDGAVDDPVELGGGPLDRVGVEALLGVSDRRVATTVVAGNAALAEVVGLHLGVVAADPLPVNLVEVVRLEHDAGHDAGTGGDTDLDVELAEEDVGTALSRGGVTLLLDRVERALVLVVGRVRSGEIVDEVALARAEVMVDTLGTERGGVGAVWGKVSRGSLWGKRGRRRNVPFLVGSQRV